MKSAFRNIYEQILAFLGAKMQAELSISIDLDLIQHFKGQFYETNLTQLKSYLALFLGQQ